jgi:hypothetical protein
MIVVSLTFGVDECLVVECRPRPGTDFYYDWLNVRIACSLQDVMDIVGVASACLVPEEVFRLYDFSPTETGTCIGRGCYCERNLHLTRALRFSRLEWIHFVPEYPMRSLLVER